MAQERALEQEEWAHRYQIERQLEQVYLREETYWRQRMGKNWLLAGDANTKFFHQFANDRHRKSTIVQLETNNGLITDQKDIMSHAVQFYKNLFGPVQPRLIFI